MGRTGRTGQRLAGRYELREQLGRGGSAEVWRARDVDRHEDVAVKVFFDLDEAADTPERRQAEAGLMARLEHPNLVAVRDVGREQGVVTHLVLDFVSGTTLRTRLQHGPMTRAEVCRLGSRLADALAYVHAHGVVHRDVKPANVMLTDDGLVDASPEHPTFDVKLTDFGVARLLDSTRMTAEGMTVGTANYLSPEQARGAPPSPHSDVYSLGLVLLEALTGDIAYPGHGVEAAVARLHRGPSLPAWLGADWTYLLEAMTEFDPARRPSMAEVATSIERIADGDPLPSLGSVLLDDEEAPAQAPSARRGMLALVGIAAATIVAVLLVSGQDSAPDRAAAAPPTVATAPPSSSSSAAPVPVGRPAPSPAAIVHRTSGDQAVNPAGLVKPLQRSMAAKAAAARAARLAAARRKAALAAARKKALERRRHHRPPPPAH